MHKKGEANLFAKLKTDQVRQIVTDAYTKTRDETTFAKMAETYGVSAGTISDIVHGKSWRHVTIGLIAQLRMGNKEVVNSCISASGKVTKKSNKLNEGLAKFIVRDHFLNKISVKKLATKFCVSDSTIRRIISGQAWENVTKPAIKEAKVWVK